MFILARQAVLFFSKDQSEKFRIPNGYVGPVPEWVAETKQFQRMAADGTIAVSGSARDKALEKAGETADKKAQKAKERRKETKKGEFAGEDASGPDGGAPSAESGAEAEV